MLEELVANERHPPAETALAVLSFLQTELPAGGTAAEKRFIRLVTLLCDRIFGKVLDAKEKYRHKEGGWFSFQNSWTRTPSTASPSPTPRRPLGQKRGLPGLAISTKKVIEEDSVLKLLGTAGRAKSGEIPPPTLIEAISKESEGRPEVCYKFPFLGLPNTTQAIWIAVLEKALGGQPSRTVCTENADRLFGDLLRTRPSDQTDLQRYRQRAMLKNDFSPGMRLSPRGFQSPVVSPRQTNLTKETSEGASPVVMLSMLEYYLFLFVRYPLAAPVPKTPQRSTPTQYRSTVRKEPYGEKIYYEVFRRMSRHFLPYEQEEARNIFFDDRFRQSELFLRIVISLWMETQAQIEPTTEVLRMIQERNSHAGFIEPPAFGLDRSYDLVQARYDPPVPLIQRCLRSLLLRAIVDPSLSKIVRDNKGRHEWCLGPTLTALQQPFYNQVRATFRHATIHSSGSPFYATFNSWLIWLEPWNAAPVTKREFSPMNMKIPKGGQQSRSFTYNHPKYDHRSGYKPDWEAYVAANLFMYTVPLAIFLRRARELDFSPGRLDASVQLVKRVFRVYTPELVHLLSLLLSGSHPTLSHLVNRHREVLGVFAPPPLEPAGGMSSYQADMHNLLDEINMQHKKTMREQDTLERLWSKAQGWFGQGVVSREEKALDSLLESARLIAQLPPDYEISPGDGPVSNVDNLVASDRYPDRLSNGELSAIGQAQLLYGQVKCDPADVHVRGDEMRMQCIRTYEVGILVELTIFLSDWLNAKIFGIAPGDTSMPFRFNLRFFADYRNLLFSIVSFYVAVKLLGLVLTIW